ncbi:hypothetical protein [Confluentibacter lentus]|uniref:hypothetical protein n=1 Tax=Confluentibacter lentus TaxID=1699412 RepID=UPI000C282842|nr:hypothetical protein [Confluentibacter lentus]
MSDTLKNIKNTGFKIPDNYFEGIEDTVLSQMKLKSIDGSGFKVPNGYFESLEDTVISKISKNENTKVINLFTRRNLLYVSSIAATILLLFNLSVFNKKSVSFETLETASVENYIMNEYIDSYDMASLLTNEDIVEENFIEHNFSEENMENYILNNIDIEDYFSE